MLALVCKGSGQEERLVEEMYAWRSIFSINVGDFLTPPMSEHNQPHLSIRIISLQSDGLETRFSWWASSKAETALTYQAVTSWPYSTRLSLFALSPVPSNV